MSGSDRAGRLPRSRCLSLYGLLSAAPAGLPAPEPSYDKLVTLAIEPGSNGLWRVHKSCWDQMAPVFALRTRKSHGDLRSWPPNFARVRTRQTFARPFICGRFKDVWPDSHLGFKDVFCVQAAFWRSGQAFPQRCARGSEGWPIASAIFHQALTILALTSRHADLSHESDLLRNPIPCGNPWLESMSQMIQ